MDCPLVASWPFMLLVYSRPRQRNGEALGRQILSHGANSNEELWATVGADRDASAMQESRQRPSLGPMLLHLRLWGMAQFGVIFGSDKMEPLRWRTARRLDLPCILAGEDALMMS
jgi:hypothetical protein